MKAAKRRERTLTQKCARRWPEAAWADNADMADDAPRGLTGRHTIEAYGPGGFRFGGMGHRGSLLLLPSGVAPWDVTSAEAISVTSLAPVFAEAESIEHLLIGTGRDIAFLDPAVAKALRAKKIVPEAMATAAAARTYNILIGERRRVAAALIATQ